MIGAVGRRAAGEGVGGVAADAARLGGLERHEVKAGAGGQAEQADGDDGLAHAGVGAGDEERRAQRASWPIGERGQSARGSVDLRRACERPRG